MLHALGADGDILELFRRGFEGHLRQYTEAKTVEVPFARDGMYYKEFPVSLDWFHHGEGFSAFFHYGLCDPGDRRYLQRARRYAGFYMDEDPQAPNYDPRHRLIRSLLNGSRGPMLRKATALDWAGDPIEVEGRFRLLHSERSYAEMLAHFEEYTDVAGDHPNNLGATQLAHTAFALGGGERYRDWLLEYVDAWVERTDENGGIIPSNVGLDGSIGGECGGRWWGGCYGWGFTVTVPQTGEPAHRCCAYARAFYGFANALLMNGKTVLHRPLERGHRPRQRQRRRDRRPHHVPPHARRRGLVRPPADPLRRRRPADLVLVPGGPGRRTRRGRRLGGFRAWKRRRLSRKGTRIRPRAAAPPRRRDARRHDHPRHPPVGRHERLNPAVTENLTRLMLGGLPTGRDGHSLHCRLRYFDADRRRAGLPRDVGALVERMDAENVDVSLVNLSPVHERTVVVQGGAYAEHRSEVVSRAGQSVEIQGGIDSQRRSAFVVAPGAGMRRSAAHRPAALRAPADLRLSLGPAMTAPAGTARFADDSEERSNPMSEALRKFRVSNDALDDGEELRRRIAGEGYLFFRGLQDADRMLALRRDMLSVIAEAGWLVPGTDPADGIADPSRACTEGDPEYTPVYSAVYKLESFHRAGHWPEVLDLMGKVIGQPVLPHPQKIARLWFRSSPTTPPPCTRTSYTSRGTSTPTPAGPRSATARSSWDRWRSSPSRTSSRAFSTTTSRSVPGV